MNEVYPALQRAGVSKHLIGLYAAEFGYSLQEITLNQLMLMKVGIEPTTSLSQVEKAAQEIYKQYKSGSLTPQETIEKIFGVLETIMKRSIKTA